MTIAVQPLVEYLLAQRFLDGPLVTTHMLQYQVPYVPPQTLDSQGNVVRSLSSVVTTIQAGDFADIGWHVSADPRMAPDVFDFTFIHYGANVSTTFLSMDTILEGIGTFIIITESHPLRWEIEHLSFLPHFILAMMHYLSVPSIGHLEEVYRRIEQYGGSNTSGALGSVEQAIQEARFPIPRARWQTPQPG